MKIHIRKVFNAVIFSKYNGIASNKMKFYIKKITENFLLLNRYLIGTSFSLPC